MRYVNAVNVTAIDRFIRKHRDAGQWLRTWIIAATAATWRSIVDVRKQYPSADGVGLKSGVIVTVFNVKGEYRLLTVVDYVAERVTVIDCLTHAEYCKGRWKG